MSQTSDDLTAASDAIVAEFDTVLAQLTSTTATLTDVSAQLAAALAANTGNDPALVTAAQSVLAKLNTETQKAKDTVAGLTPPPAG